MLGGKDLSGGPSGPPRDSWPGTLRGAFRFHLRKQGFEDSQAAWREVDGSAVRISRGPALLVDVSEQFSTEGTREMRTPLAPVEAGAAQRASRVRKRGDVDAETAEE